MNNLTPSIVVLGAGGHAKVVISTYEALGWRIVGVYDDDPKLWNTRILGHNIVGPFAQAETLEPQNAVIAIGDNAVRKRVSANSKHAWPTAVHPRAWVAPTAVLGAGTIVFAGSIVQPDVRVGEHCIVNTAASIDHDCLMEDFVHVCPGTRLAGGVVVGQGSTIGTGAVVIPYKKIGQWVTVGAGAVVRNNIDSGLCVVGVPAKPIGINEKKR